MKSPARHRGFAGQTAVEGILIGTGRATAARHPVSVLGIRWWRPPQISGTRVDQGQLASSLLVVTGRASSVCPRLIARGEALMTRDSPDCTPTVGASWPTRFGGAARLVRTPSL
jgi:hypothetical protein